MNIGVMVFGDIPQERRAELLKENGIERTFIASEIPDFDEVMQLYIDKGITVETLHAPFQGINAMWSEDDKEGEEMLLRLIDSVDKCAKYGIPTTIVHVSSGRPMPEISEKGIARYERLFDYAKEKGVKVALENLRYLENLAFLMERYDYPVFCWDTGHENCYTDGVKYMEHFGERLGALHIHDNKVVKDRDDHLLPYDGNIDFEEVAQHIAKNGNNITVMLEVNRGAKIDDTAVYGDISDEEYVKRAADAVRKLASRIEEIRK